ncbi:dihydrodipicolinate synthase family protein [Arthrobacter crusticola]|uniref:Dihydrodipicolinate synthase family protein n=1 Tax=Arthrobacter crusticola TaxID=2547960 RepID=A0A4R5U359_9MICC|nr:dihydrodipicolinate synthase family protein [Arthrobacter crusticola]TDK28087.1 dihydrodipicolinate synthase family protein [Arthrobacter crusticola]
MTFAGLVAYPITPFTADGGVNTPELAALISSLAVSGVDTIAVLGSSGSFAFLSSAERDAVARTAVEAAAGAVPVVVGISSVGTREVLAAARSAERAGASGLVLSPVSYVPLTEEEVSFQVRTVAESTDLPICLYNNPRTTQFSYGLELVAELLALPSVVAFKDTAADVASFRQRYDRLRSLTDATFSHGLSGDLLIASGELAADAWHTGPAALLPAYYARFRAAVTAGDASGVAECRRVLLPVVQHVVNLRKISGLHLLARVCGIDAGDPRLPLLPVPGSEQRELARLVDVVEEALALSGPVS